MYEPPEVPTYEPAYEPTASPTYEPTAEPTLEPYAWAPLMNLPTNLHMLLHTNHPINHLHIPLHTNPATNPLMLPHMPLLMNPHAHQYANTIMQDGSLRKPVKAVKL